MNMALFEAGSFCDGASDQCTIYSSSQSSQNQQRIEIYTFIDPTCPECWALEPILKKLQIEYGQYFKMRYLIGGRLGAYQTNANETSEINEYAQKWEKTARQYGMPCDGDVWTQNPIPSSYQAALAVKTAELQGKQAGLRFLRKLRESFFLNKRNIAAEDVLLDCANKAGLDVAEFQRDIHTNGAVKAYQCDMKITSEMEVEQLPTLVFLDADEAGVKVSGYYPYEAYEQVLCEMMGNQPQTAEPPEIEDFLKKYPFVATMEIAMVYNLSCAEVDREMKKLLLRQQVERIPVKNGTFWHSLDKA